MLGWWVDSVLSFLWHCGIVVCTYGFVCWLCIMMIMMIMVWYGMFYVNMGMEDSGLVSLYDMYSLAWQIFLYNPTSSLFLILLPLHTHNLTLLKPKPHLNKMPVSSPIKNTQINHPTN